MRGSWLPMLCLFLALPSAALAQVRSPKIDAIEAIAPRPLATCPKVIPIACGQTINDSLTPFDCTLPDGTAVNYYQFAGTNGESITATLSSTVFPPLLELMDPNGHVKTSNSSNVPETVQVPPSHA